MPKTVVGLFENPARLEEAVHAIEALGFPRKEVRTLREPATFEVTGVMSFPRLDFETDLSRELTRIGATASEAQAYLDGVRRGGALALATGSDGNMDDAARIMNLYGAIKTEELTGTEPIMPVPTHLKRPVVHDSPVLSGRTSHAGGGACLFVW